MPNVSTFRCWKFKKSMRCKWCRRLIELRTTDRAKVFAFDPKPPVLREDQHPVTLVKYDVLEASALHSRSCPNRSERAAADRKKKRGARRFAAQGRLL